MKTNEILSIISGNGGFDNFRKWSKKDIQVWVKSYFECSNFVAEKVANHLY